MLWFWDPGSSESIRQMKDLASICEEYSPQGFRLITIALDDDIGKISRFHQHNQMNWAAAAEPLSASAVQVLGITRGPHIIMLDENNRILVREDEFPGKNELRDLIETRFDRQQEM